MGSAVSASSVAKDRAEARRRSDRLVLIIFSTLAGITIAASLGSYIVFGGAKVRDVVAWILGGLSVSFLMAGVPAYLRRRKSGLVLRRRILRLMAISSVAITALTLAGLALIIIFDLEVVEFGDASPAILLIAGIVIVIALFVTYLLLIMVVFLAIFGTMGVMSAVERSLAPWTLRQIARLSSDKKPSLVSRGIRWLFDVPDVLDTTTLSIRPAKPRTYVSLSDLKTPVLWQLFFGFILAIYMSFNPFVSDRSPAALLSIFSLLTTASILIPLIILPWFLFMRLGAGIRGQTKPFTLYNGIRSRVFQSYLAVGTIVIFVRLSIQEISIALETYVAAFAMFMVTLLGAALLSTFVYYNYFENELVVDVVDRLRGTEVRIEDIE